MHKTKPTALQRESSKIERKKEEFYTISLDIVDFSSHSEK